MNSKIPINASIDSGSLSLPASLIFQKEKNTYLCPFCVTKLEKFEHECSDCHRKMDWSRFIDKNIAHHNPFGEASVL